MNQNFKKRITHVDKPETHHDLLSGLNESLKNWRDYSDIIVVCIGTDRSSGDCVGPLVGYLMENKLKVIKLYGTLENPVHALNLEDTVKKIKETYENPFVIAVDACLGKVESIGFILMDIGSIRPGSAVGKELPNIGNYSIKGIVNVSGSGGYLESLVLQNTRLNLVMKMSNIIADSIIKADKRLYQNEQRRTKRSLSKLMKEALIV